MCDGLFRNGVLLVVQVAQVATKEYGSGFRDAKAGSPLGHAMREQRSRKYM